MHIHSSKHSLCSQFYSQWIGPVLNLRSALSRRHDQEGANLLVIHAGRGRNAERRDD
jgi:hypothetical protein